jgi:hypothetical protein
MASHSRRPPAPPALPADLEEVRNLLEGFANELRKLDESLEVLSAYLVRLQSRPPGGDRTLH